MERMTNEQKTAAKSQLLEAFANLSRFARSQPFGWMTFDSYSKEYAESVLKDELLYNSEVSMLRQAETWNRMVESAGN